MALHGFDWPHLEKLMECSRSIPLRLMHVSENKEVALAGIEFSVTNKHNSRMKDAFVSWLSKFEILLLPWLKREQILYDGQEIQMPWSKLPSFLLCSSTTISVSFLVNRMLTRPYRYRYIKLP